MATIIRKMAAARDPAFLSSFDLSGILAPEQERKVPNHLTDTKIFAKLGQNEVLQARPTSVHFNGFEVGKVHSKTLKIINTSAERQRMHIIPPVSQNFKIRYTKEDTLVPGLYLEVTVLFRGSQYQYYNDCIRIHSKANENLVVPLYAYPVMDIESFPSNLHFPPTPVGQRITRTIPLQCNYDINFEFQVTVLQKNPAFSIEPFSGLIGGGKKVDLIISFTPQEYCTAQMQFQVLLSEFNAKPLVCSVTGSSIPGLTKELIEKRISKKSDEPDGVDDVVDPRALSPLNRSRNRKSERKRTNNVINNSTTKDIIHEGIKFPTNLNNPAAVAYVLTQKTGKLKAKDIREAVKDREKNRESSKQMKEAVFEHLVNRQVAEEERNQLRWCIKLGDDHLSNMEREKILADRQRALADYCIQRGDPQLDEEFDRSTTLASLSRIQRQAGEYASDSPTFDIHASDVWNKRHALLNKFVQAARKVLIRERVKGHIRSLSKYMGNWRRGRFSTDHIRNWEELDHEQQIMSKMSLSVDPAKVKFFNFPDYDDPNVKDDMAVDALGTVQTSPTDVEIKEHIQFHGLQVPSQYKVLGYKSHAAPSSIYVPKGLARALRDGPEDLKTDVATPTDGQAATSTYVDKVEILPAQTDTGAVDSTQDDVTAENVFLEEFQLVAPSVLFKKREYPPLHIFNPEPGVLLQAPQLRMSEAEEENKLLPVPTGTDNRSIIKLHKEDVIQGSMTWKRFSLQGLVSLNNTPTLSNVYVPRWSDPFGSDMMPESSPALLTQLPDEDAPDEEEDAGQESSNIVPNMEMVRAQFVIPLDSQMTIQENSESFATTGKLPSTNNPIGKTGPLSRLSREKELDKLIKDRKDKLGQRITINTENFKQYLNLDAK